MNIRNFNYQSTTKFVYRAFNTVTDEMLTFDEPTQIEAKLALIDKLGYRIIPASPEMNFPYVLVDADDNSIVEAAIHSSTFDKAVDEVLTAAQWVVNEPEELVD